VQFRQAACFATLGEVQLAHEIFDWSIANGFDPRTGHMACWLSSELRILTAPNDLYDITFAGFAAAALLRADVDVEYALMRIERALDRLRAPIGWYENTKGSLPRRQNPHMHLFEMATVLFEVTRAPRFLAIAEECLGLFHDRFLRNDGCIMEYFSADMTPLSANQQAIEPGHMAEWIFLLDQYEKAAGLSSGVSPESIWKAVLDRRDGSGLLPDRSDPDCGTRRLWPQSELLKAACIMHARGALSVDEVNEVLRLIFSEYLNTNVSGGWFDKRSADGTLLSNTMPASTFYHLVTAFTVYFEQVSEPISLQLAANPCPPRASGAGLSPGSGD
jgi:mannose-6-phosphate isomerase